MKSMAGLHCLHDSRDMSCLLRESVLTSFNFSFSAQRIQFLSCPDFLLVNIKHPGQMSRSRRRELYVIV